MKNYFTAKVIVIIVLGGLCFILFKHENLNTTSHFSQKEWKIYNDTATGFSIKYPPQYKVHAENVTTDTPWGSRTLLTIYDPSSTSENEFHVEPVRVIIRKQPIVASGYVYHTIAEYQQSGIAAQMVQGVPNPDGKLVIVNGMQALMYYFPPGDASDASIDSYFLIKDEFIYEVLFNAGDPNKKAILQSIAWR